MVNLDTILLGMPWSLGDHQCSNTTPPHETNDQSLKKWKVQTRKTMFIIKVSIEEDMLEHIKNATAPKTYWDTFVTLFFKKNEIPLQNI